MRNNRVRLAAIGVGMIGQLHVKIIKSMEASELVAICDNDSTKTELAKSLGVPYYQDFKQMIHEVPMDGVIISLPNALHESVASACAEKGLHIFLEKPITSVVSEGEQLIKNVKKNNVQLLIAHHRRFNPMIVAMRDIIQSGELGQLIAVSVLWGMYKPSEYFAEAPWRKDIGGGPILINTIHEIDNLRFICGEIERVYAETNNKARKFDVEDSVSVSLRFKNGTLATILMSDATPSPWAYECTMGENPFFQRTKGNIYHYLGTQASISFPGMLKMHYSDATKAGWQHQLTTTQLDVQHADPYLPQLQHFCAVIQGKEKPRTSGEDALQTLKVTMALHESAKAGKSIIV